MERKVKIDASFLLYLLDLFEGKLRAEEIKTMDIPLITELQKLQEEKLERQAKDLEARRNQNVTQQKTVNNRGERYTDKS